MVTNVTAAIPVVFVLVEDPYDDFYDDMEESTRLLLLRGEGGE